MVANAVDLSANSLSRVIAYNRLCLDLLIVIKPSNVTLELSTHWTKQINQILLRFRTLPSLLVRIFQSKLLYRGYWASQRFSTLSICTVTIYKFCSTIVASFPSSDINHSKLIVLSSLNSKVTLAERFFI